jgi:uncharacterized tellurite resistance protein B-like protein
MQQEQATLLKNYSLPERGAYLGALATMALADGNVSAEEIDFLTLMSEAAELPQTMQQEVQQIARNPSQVSLQKCLDVLKGSPLRFSFITDLISFAKVDGQLSAPEQKRIQDMSAYLGVSEQQFSILNEFVDKAGQAQQGEDPTSPAFLTKSGFDNLFKTANISPQMVQGMLGVLAPIVLSKMISGGHQRGRNNGLGGLLSGLMGGNLNPTGGGLGSFTSILSNLGGRSKHNRMSSGGLGGLFKNLFGGNRHH